MYVVCDHLESFEGDILGKFETLEDARKCMKQQEIDTDGDCYIVIYKDNMPIEENLYI